MTSSARHNASRAGFTMVELVIVLTIFSVIAGAMMLQMVTGSAVSAQETTLKRMHAIEQAMTAHWLAFGRIPCPARVNSRIDSGTSTNHFGLEQGEPGDCRSGLTGGVANQAMRGPIAADCDNWNSACPPPPSCTDNCSSILGSVPVRQLNLPDEYALDGWNRNISYIVDQRYTAEQANRPVPSLIVTENHAAPASAIEIGRFPALLMSHGKAGHRAARPDATNSVTLLPSTMSPNDEELHNLDPAQFNNRFVLQPFRPDLPRNEGRFDVLLRPVSIP